MLKRFWANFKKGWKTFWSEARARWKAKEPYFFRIVKRFSLTLATLSGFIETMKFSGTSIPPPFDGVAIKITFFAAVVGFIVSKWTVDTPAATQTVIRDIKEESKKE